MSEEVFDFTEFATIARDEKPFEYDKKQFVLVEADGEVTARYKAQVYANSVVVDGKFVPKSGMADVEAFLVSLCVFEIDPQAHGGRKAVTIKEVKSWPGRMVKKLFQAAKKLSQMGDEETIDSLERQRDDINDQIEKLKAAKAKDSLGN